MSISNFPNTGSGRSADISSLLALADIATMAENERYNASRTNSPSIAANVSSAAPSHTIRNAQGSYFSRNRPSSTSNMRDSPSEHEYYGSSLEAPRNRYTALPRAPLYGFSPHTNGVAKDQNMNHMSSRPMEEIDQFNGYANEEMIRHEQRELSQPTSHQNTDPTRPAKKRSLAGPPSLHNDIRNNKKPSPYGIPYGVPDSKHAIAEGAAAAAAVAVAKASSYSKQAGRYGRKKPKTTSNSNSKPKKDTKKTSKKDGSRGGGGSSGGGGADEDATFPTILMAIMTAPHNEGVIAFLSDEQSFIIINPMMLQKEVLPLHFQDKHGKPTLKSVNQFEDLLDVWGFDKVTDPRYPKVNVYRHNMFKKGDWEACLKMTLPTNADDNDSSIDNGKINSHNFDNHDNLKSGYESELKKSPSASSFQREQIGHRMMEPPSVSQLRNEQRSSTPNQPEQAHIMFAARSVTPSDNLSPSAQSVGSYGMGSAGDLTGAPAVSSSTAARPVSEENLRSMGAAKLESSMLDRMSNESQSQRLSEMMGMSTSQLEHYLTESSNMSAAYRLLLQQRIERRMLEEQLASSLEHQGRDHRRSPLGPMKCNHEASPMEAVARRPLFSRQESGEDDVTSMHRLPSRMPLSFGLPRPQTSGYTDAEIEYATENVVSAAIDAIRRDKQQALQRQLQQQQQLQEQYSRDSINRSPNRGYESPSYSSHISTDPSSRLDAMTEEFLSRSMARLQCRPAGIAGHHLYQSMNGFDKSIVRSDLGIMGGGGGGAMSSMHSREDLLAAQMRMRLERERRG